MLSIARVHDQALETAEKRLGEDKLDGVSVEETSDSHGDEALRIVLKLKRDTARLIDGDQALDLLVELRHALNKAGEDRLPIIEYEEEGEESEGVA